MEASKWADPPKPKPESPAQADPEPASDTPLAPLQPLETYEPPQPPPDSGLFVADDAYDDIDEFAQTRPPDDLFGDDFTPMDEPVVETLVHESPQPPTGPRAAGRGRGHARRGAYAATTRSVQPHETEQAEESLQTPVDAQIPRVSAVRGDRSRTGGVKKTKLTEEELAARMEAVKLKNASLEAAYARAEADEASFQAREAEAQEKRRLDRQNRQQMMGERERNRQRKLNAMGGRDWDADKDEAELALDSKGRGSQFRRGAYGGVVGAPANHSTDRPQEDGNDFEADEPSARSRGGFRGRGRGGRGRGRGRGGFDQDGNSSRDQTVPRDADFPALGASKSPSVQTVAASRSKDADTVNPVDKIQGSTKGSSWADQMDSAPSSAKA